MRYAAELPIADFEDALQAACALVCGERHVVTRNTLGTAEVRPSAPSARQKRSPNCSGRQLAGILPILGSD